MALSRVTIERILCPTDFSACSERALQRAVGLARWFGARVTALHVIGNARWSAMTMKGGLYMALPPDALRAQREAAEKELRRLAESVRGEGVPFEGKLVEGDPARAIQALAGSLPAHLLVMGTHGWSGLEHLLLGSVAERVLRTAPCPVLTVREDPTELRNFSLFRRILCAVDLTKASERTLDMAFSLAEETLARVTLLHVVEGLLGESGPELYRPVPETGRLRRQLVDEAMEQLQRVGQRAQGFCDLRERVETGSAWRQILGVAEETYADLIVMGAHAHGAVGRMFFGSTANQVVRHATCPVLTVREVRPAQPARAEETADVTAAGRSTSVVR
jgi:nucleotide-binding universal stress UspA family protein